MPKLDDAKRQEIDAKFATHKRIMASFDGRRFVSIHCRFCNWASNGHNLDEAVAESRAHEATHPEKAEFDTVDIDHRDLLVSIHDHECVYANCVCKCGCQNDAGCILVFGPLCPPCHIRDWRGDKEHGEKEATL